MSRHTDEETLDQLKSKVSKSRGDGLLEREPSFLFLCMVIISTVSVSALISGDNLL